MLAHHTSDTAKHFTADELYEIALDEDQKAGRHIGQSERMGLTQWAYWSAEYDDFHTEEEAREELRVHLSEEACNSEE